ncbi:uncharacterized protein A4U43_C03F22100 [Asparagus officinalis]|uniref:Kinesin motor domain-containing protein n=1 Tax=Asparagus officinalis TaxID=4686 RepID=A0A5P1FDW0_ASPOF|nr:uncharacterized protein A4U43_C03F22100 [Asparagus officinalis]
MSFSGDVIDDDELALRKTEEAAARRSQAAQWLREMDREASKTLARDPSEEEFCLALRNGLILCNVLNRVNPGAVSKVVENPVVAVESMDAAAQSAIQYFENMRNFLDAVAEMKLLTFEASDLEKGGSSSKVVECILCLKGYHEWKLAGGIGVWRYGGLVKITSLSRWSSPLIEIANGDELFDNKQQLEQAVRLLGEDLVEELKATNKASSMFDQFGLRLLQAFLTELGGDEELPLNPMLVDLVLDLALKEIYLMLASQRNQLGSLLKKKLKDESGNMSKVKFMEAILRHLKLRSCGSDSCLNFCKCSLGSNINNEERLDLQQKQLEKLKLSFQEMRVQVECSKRKWEEDLEKFEKRMEGLNINASLYYKLLEENRMLYNQVQDLKGNIRVYCRVRPFLSNQSDTKSTVDHIGENGNIMIINPHKQGKDARKIFSFNKVFGANTTQGEVFADTQPLIRSVMDGYNVCIFAYGQTGSGKTHTMSGPDIKTEETWGVNYRALNDLFNISKSRTSVLTYDISVQMIEIYNEQVRDLLVADGSNRRYPFQVQLCLVSVNCTEDVLELMKVGQGNRAVGATALNERSSRSHSVLTIHVQGKELVSGSIVRGCLHLVDLAGSERVDKSEATGERLKEAQHINRSLSALGDVIFALAQKSSHIPYRNSKLTQVLQDALGGQAKTLMFVHINPEINSFGETISTLKFAERVSSIELGAARANKETGEVRDLKDEISKLKSALESKESEVAQLKDYSSRMAMEVKNLRNVSPLLLQKHGCNLNFKPDSTQRPASDARYTEKHGGNLNFIPDGTQRPATDARHIESRSCSSGKQRKPRFPSISSDKEHDSRSPFSAEENLVRSRRKRSPSPIRMSLSSDRATVIKTKPKSQNLDEKLAQKLHFPEKTSISSPIKNIPALLSSTRRVFSEHDEEQFRTTIFKRKLKAVSKNVGMDTGGILEARKKSDFSETENDSNVIGSPVIYSFKEKKLQYHETSVSQNIEPRTFLEISEPLATMKHENKPPIRFVRNGKERNKTAEPEIRRSRSLPRGKFTIS